MGSPRASGPVLLASSATALLLAGRLFPLPPLVDAAAGLPVPGARLAFPLSHLLLTPLSVSADWLTCLGASQHAALLAWLAALFAAWRLARRPARRGWRAALREEGRAAAAGLSALLALYAWTALFPRRPARLILEDPDWASVDLHSHSARSWDGRRSFTPEANARWHEAAGFDAAFLTDHNLPPDPAGLDAAAGAGVPLLAGQEWSLHHAHLVVLGPSALESKDYGGGLQGVERALRDARRRGLVTVMSLPEYWKHAWGADLERLADWGLSGFEIHTAAPKALDFPAGERERVLELCRRRGLFAAAATDNHGWGRSACSWNLLRLPGWRGLDRAGLERVALAALRRGGSSAVVTLRRARVEPGAGIPLPLDPPAEVWTLLRTLSGAQALAAGAWAWGLALAFSRLRR